MFDGEGRGIERLQQEIPSVVVDFDPVTKSPKWIGANSRLLTGPQKELAAQDKDAPITRFIDAHRQVFGHGAEALAQARRVTDYTTARSNSRKVVWHQQHEGIDIFEAVLQANLSSDSALINIGSQFMASPQAAEAALPATPGIRGEQAVAAAGRNLGENIQAESIRPMGPASDQPDRRQQFRAALLTDADARLSWLPMDTDTLRLTWDITLTSRSRAEMYRVLVDAETGDVLVRHAMTAYISDATYRVFTTESPTPFSPGHLTPSSLQPPPVSRVLVTTPALNTTASPAGWINDGVNITSGNNADAYTDVDNNNVADLPRTTGSPNRVFDFPYNLTQEPANLKDASVTQLFYWTNFMHDRMYELGFTEAAGNFQTDNFGRGGVGNDPVNAEAQDGSGTNNANFSTPVDGGRGRMQMFNWTSPTPDRDGSFEAEVVLHEYAHGVSNRLVGGPSVTISSLATRGMGEGWSDFYGLALTAQATDNPHGNWARAGWSRYLTSNWLSENYYYGARRYSYSTDMTKNPHTFRDIDPNQVDWHVSVPRNPTYAATQDASQVHYVGTVWATTLWDIRANLILKHGFAIGNERALFLVTEGMKLGPANPNFIQARDGILQAALVNHPADLGEVWTAFAKRGMGDGAAAPVSTTTTGITEQYDVPDGLEINDRNGWNITGSAASGFLPATKVLTLSNDSSTTVNWTAAPNASWLFISPASGSLAPGANVSVTVTTQAATMPAGFHSTNIVFGNTSTGFLQPVGVRLTVTPPAVHAFDLSSNPGWSVTGQWAHGIPTGAGGTASGGAGNPDPTAGATGSHVYGVNLSGNASTTVGGPFYLTSSPVNLTARRATRLRFKRWLNSHTLTNTRMTVQISTNGTDWRDLFVNPGAVITDNAWQTMEYDISSIADQQPAVQVRWGYQNLVSTTAYSGWNIDDIEFLGESSAQFTLDIPASVSEGSAPVTGTLHLNLPQPSPVTVVLNSSNPAAATVQPTITLAANEVTQTFTLTPVDDNVLDGVETTYITAAAAGIATASHLLAVNDDETATLSLSAPTNVNEGSTGHNAVLTVSAPPTQAVTVQLSSSSNRLVLPASVTIPANSTGPVPFTFDSLDNQLAEGPQNVSITATVAGWADGSAVIGITDDETATITLTGPTTTHEGSAPLTFTVAVNTVQATDRILNLGSSDVSELTVPATVTIPAGQFSATFDATVVDDTDFDGLQQVVITASAAGYAAGVLTVNVRDNEVSTYTLGAIPSPQRRNEAFPVFITAKDIHGNTITSHTGGVTLTSSSPGGPVPFTTSGTAIFSQGTATIDVTVTATATTMTLTATDTGGKAGTSNSFDVLSVTHAGFVITSPFSTNADTFFNTTATAVDDQGTTYTGYAEPTVLDVLLSYVLKTVGSTTTTATTANIHNTAAHDSRAQMIYTAAEIGNTPQLLSNFVVSKTVAGGQPMLGYTVRLKHTTLENFDGRSWEDGGWTTVHTSASYAATTTSTSFIKPFAYDGVRNLMIDISFDNASASTAGLLRQVPATGNRVLYGSSNSAHGSPLTWTAATGPVPTLSNELPSLSFFAVRSVGPLPASPAVFANGTWSGQALIPASGYLRATAQSGVWGTSNYVIGLSPSNPASTEAIFSDGFETGALGTGWSIADNSGATARTQVTTANVPRAGSYHLTMDTTSTSTGTFAANRPTLTVNLTGKKNVWLEWYQKGFLEDYHIMPLTGPLGTMEPTSNYDGVAISPDGVTWVQAAAMSSLPVSYSATVSRVALDPIIQRMGWSYNNSFRIRFSQYDDQAMPDDGIALDDIALRANAAASIGLSLPATIEEGTLNVPVTVSLPMAAASSTTVTLLSNIPGRLSVVSPVVIPAGQTTGSTTISAPQNFFAEGGRGAVISASATGQTTAYHHVRIVDDEQPVITMTLPASVTEGGGSGLGTVSLEPAQTQTTIIYLASSAPGEALVMSHVTLSAGINSASFLVSPVNDTRVDGTQVVTITASGQGMVSASGTVDVLDNETATITVTPPPTLVEGGAARVGSVAIAGIRAGDTVISLVSDDVTEATVPASVTIPAGQLSANFLATPVEDSLQDGQQTVTITASTPGMLAGTATFIVLDNDPASFEWTAIPSPQTRNVPFTVTLTAKDETENTVTGFHGTVTLTAKAGASALSVTPTTTATFVNGVWTGNVTVGETGTGVTLQATGSDGSTGSSDAFDVVSGGAAVALAFDAVPQPQNAGAPIPVRVRAVDANGVLVNEANGPVTVSLVTAPAGTVVASASLTLVNGSATTTFLVPAPLSSVRLVGGTGTLQGQGATFSIVAPGLISHPPPELVFADGFESGSFKPEWVISGTGTHRTQISGENGPRSGAAHLVMDSSTDVSLARNEATLTLNLAGKSDVVLSFWMKESGDEDHGPPTAPFITGANFDGVAISADGNTWYEVQGLRTADGISSIYKQFTINLSTAAAARGLTLNPAFKIRFNHYDDYTYGTDGFAFDDIRVEANALAPPEPVVTLFEDDFEMGLFKPQWAITGTNNHRTEITAQHVPRGNLHMVMDAHTTSDSRNEATLTLDTSAHQDVVLKFWMKENSDEDQAPPSNPFTGGADYDGVAVSVDGTTWYEVQPLRGTASTNSYQEFTVDIDAALNTWGLTHGPGLKIRFNHFDNYSWVGGDGFAFDDITITGRPVQALAVETPAVITEGSQVTARARIPATRSEDTVVTLTTNRPGSLTVPTSVTIPAGSLVSADFMITAVQNTVLTGSQQAQVVASAEGLRRGAATIEIQDDEAAAGFDLVMPGTLAEGGTINGSVSISNPSLFDLPVALSAVPSFGLTLPAMVILPAGSTSVFVPLSKPENQMVLESTSTQVTARLGASADAAVVALGDNDAAVPLVITLPASVSESAGPVAGSVGFAPPILSGRELVIGLGSSNAGTLGVPTTVTLPAGSGSVAFHATPQDNALADGTRVVTLTATAAGVTGGTHEISVQDDELHHFTVDEIASPQIALQPFSVFIRARTIDNQLLSNFTGTAALSATNTGGAVTLTPVTTGSFSNGTWTGQITIPNPAASVVLTAATSAGAHGSSNAFDVIPGPRLAISSTSLNVISLQGEVPVTRTLSLTNPGVGNANWSTSVIGSAPWLSLGQTNGSVPEGGSANVTTTFTAGSLAPGVYNATLRFTSNDPSAPQQNLPVTFTVMAGVNRFVWGTIPLNQPVNEPFTTTLTATDSQGGVVSAFNGSASISLQGALVTTASGNGTTNSIPPFYSSAYADYRTQGIYLPLEVGGKGSLKSMQFNLYGSANIPNVTIRLKHTEKTAYSTSAGTATWETTGWTTVFAGTLSAPGSGWAQLNFSTPFEYDGVRNLMVDISYDNVAPTTGPTSAATSTTTTRMLTFGGTVANGPLDWSGTTPTGTVNSTLPTVRFSRRPSTPAHPSMVTFANGTWTGSLSGTTSGVVSAIATHSSNPAVSGESSTFTLTSTGSLTLTIPGSGTEGSSLNATVTASTAPGTALTVFLASSDTTEATVPATVTIPAGQTSASFEVTLPEDTDLDGSRKTAITARAANLNQVESSVMVHDNETTIISVTVPATLSEGASASTGTVTLAAAPTEDVAILLASSDTSELTVLPSVTIPAGSTSATFVITPVNDTLIDFTQTVDVTASMPGWTGGSGTILITDNETATLSLSFTSSVGEAQGTLTATLLSSSAVEAATTVTLVSADTTEATVPATATIAAGSSVTTFTITVINETETDGSQTFAITATSPGFATGTRNLTVTDNDVHNFLVSGVAASQVRNHAFNVTFTARDINNTTITSYSGSPVLTAREGGTSLVITPGTITGFSSGVKTQAISIGSLAASAMITITDPATGGAGNSNAFAVGFGALDHFGVSVVQPSITTGIPQQVTFTAQDAGNNTVTTFNQTATLAITNDSNSATTGTGTSTWTYPLGSQSRAQRTQCIYLPAEVGSARVLNNLALYVTSLPGSSFSGLTIRMKHTALTAYSAVSWESTGWTTVYQADTPVVTTGWRQFDFTTPFTYDGTSSLMIDFSYYNATAGTTQGATRYSSSPTTRTALNETNINYGNPLTWAGTATPAPVGNNALPNVRFGTTSVTLPVTPSVTGAFVAGVWSGSVTPSGTGNQVKLRATNGAVTGSSNAFDVVLPPELTLTLQSTVSESAGTVSGTVTITPSQSLPTVVSLSSNDSTAAAPTSPTVTIPPGSTSAGFTLDIVNDTLKDGTQSVVITASAASANSGIATLSVTDDDVHNFLVSAVGTQIRGASFNVTFTARDVNNVTIPGYVGSPTLSAVDGAAALTVSPSSVTDFTSGVCTQSVRVGSFAANAVLTITDVAASASGSSNGFAVTAGAFHHFGVSPIPSPQVVGQPFPVTVTAQDAVNNPIPGYSGGAIRMDLTSFGGAGSVQVGTATGSASLGLTTTSSAARSQHLYLASEVGTASRIRGLGLTVATASAGVVNNFTIRIKHTSLATFPSNAPAFEDTGWTTVYAGHLSSLPAGAATFDFSTPFDYNGVDNLMVDLSFTNPGSQASSSALSTFSPTGFRSAIVLGTSNPPVLTYGTPVGGGTTSAAVPVVTFLRDTQVNATPGSTGAFSGGEWTGNVTVSTAVAGLVIRPVGGTSVASNTFDVLPAKPAISAEPAFTGGTSNTLNWAAVPSATAYRIQSSTTADFSQSVQDSGDTAQLSRQYPSLVSGQQYFYRLQAAAPAVALAGKWSQTLVSEFLANTSSNVCISAPTTEARLARGNVIVVENFDGAGAADFSATLFSDTGSATHQRSELSAGPATTPILPINQGGDMEGRLTGSKAAALMPSNADNVFTDGSIEAYLGPEDTSTFIYTGLLLRASRSGSGDMINGYQAKLITSVGGGSSLGISRVVNGADATGINGILYPAASLPALAANEHWKMRFSATGPTLVAMVWKVRVTSGSVSETLAATVTRTDHAFTSGVAGLYSGQTATAYSTFDDVIVTKGNGDYVASGSMISPAIAPASKLRWGIVSFSSSKPPGASLSVDVLHGATNTVLAADVASGTDLNSLPAVAAVDSLKLRANLSTTTTTTPSLLDWSLTYPMSDGTVPVSPWSNTVSSTQDATPPALGIPELTTGGASATLAGTATDAISGVATVTVNGSAASTANAFANWTRGLTGLSNGSNSFTISASDKAVPANTTSLTAVVYRIANPTGDGDGNGISSLLEHALGIPAAAANPRAMLPAVTVQTDGGTGEKFLTLQFRRRLQRNGLTYTVETSTNLTTWDNTGASVQEMSAVPTGDGVTETVTVRVTPNMSTAGKKFVRLSVTTN